MFSFRKKKQTDTKAMSELKSVSQVKSLSEFSSTEAELFKPYAPNSEFELFSLDEGLEVLVMINTYCNKRVVIILRDYIHGNITLDDATRTILEFVPAGNESALGDFGSCMLHTAEQIPYTHPGGQARLVQLLRNVHYYHRPGATNQFGIMVYENFEPDLEDYDERPTPARGDPLGLALNLGAFYARLSQDGMLNMTTPGIRTMRNLEYKRDDSQDDDCCVRLAALWIIFSGQRLYTQVVEAPPIREAKKHALHDPGALYKGPVYGRERWAFWRDMLKGAADREAGSAESRELAKKAADLMDVIERSVQF